MNVASALALDVLFSIEHESDPEQSRASLCIRGYFDASQRIEIQHMSRGLKSYRMAGNDWLFPVRVHHDDVLVVVVYNADNGPAVCGYYTVQMAPLEYGRILDEEIYNTLAVRQQEATVDGLVASIKEFLGVLEEAVI